MKCPFCKNENTVKFSEFKTDDCWRISVECSNCGLRGPGVFELGDENCAELALKFWNEMYVMMITMW